MPGAIATNFARNFDPEFVAGIAKASGVEVEIRKGEKLPDEVLAKLQLVMKQLLGAPEDVADAVLYAVSQPSHVNVAELVVRPPKQLQL
jgi:NADP-dependent 3-hydroxy acid dehydrogenase YdfG